jgi:hypothetical protein
MKNLHLISTEKPSRLYLHSNNTLQLRFDISRNHDEYLGSNQHIYITNDEEIKEGDWIKLFVKHIDKDWIHKITKEDLLLYTDFNNEGSKIILTTDQDLINDGVQAIDEDFLEWFVKNSSCEEVKVENTCLEIRVCDCAMNENCLKPGYKIIIPKEEPKQETHICKWCKAETWQSDDECYAKQETLEEAAEKYTKDGTKHCMEKTNVELGFIAGAKWQHQQYVDFSKYNADKITTASTTSAKIENKTLWKEMYSEEEVLDIVHKCGKYCYDSKKIGTDIGLMPDLLTGFFNQFKK